MTGFPVYDPNDKGHRSDDKHKYHHELIIKLSENENTMNLIKERINNQSEFIKRLEKMIEDLENKVDNNKSTSDKIHGFALAVTFFIGLGGLYLTYLSWLK